jgi:uncharacterized protein (TIGR02246 family)
MVTTTKSIVEKINDAFARNDMEAFLAYCADDVVWTMVGDTTKKGRENIRDWMKSMPAEAPTFDVKEVVAEGDFVVCQGDMTMKEGADKPEVPYSYVDWYRFRDGKIVELRSWIVKTAGK